MVSILWMKKLSIEFQRGFAQSHTTGEWQTLNVNRVGLQIWYLKSPRSPDIQRACISLNLPPHSVKFNSLVDVLNQVEFCPKYSG